MSAQDGLRIFRTLGIASEASEFDFREDVAIKVAGRVSGKGEGLVAR